MLAKVKTIALIGLEGSIVDVEVDLSRGLFSFNIVGLASKAVQESKERVMSAIKNLGFVLPAKKITVNLAPADLMKSGPFYDIPIAVAILLASEQIILTDLDQTIFWGELSLKGETRQTRGALAVTDSAKRSGFHKIFLPHSNSAEASLVQGIDVIPLVSLQEITHKPKSMRPRATTQLSVDYGVNDFQYIKGQFHAKRALEISAVGGHNSLLSGSPGSGKTYLAKSLLSILPDMAFDESLEVTKIYSVAGLLGSEDLMVRRPFRNPHHTSSHVALVGGGSIPRPGEISLAHRGVLFLDEFTEFTSKSLEALRQPLEDKIVHISRAAGMTQFPANFMLVAAMNPCKCGYLSDPSRECICTSHELEKYSQRISGPILDRIDLYLQINRVEKQDLVKAKAPEGSSIIKARIEKSKKFQQEIYAAAGLSGVYSNSDLNHIELKQVLHLARSEATLLGKAIENLRLSARSYYRLLRVARSIADLDLSERVTTTHISEAISFRKIEQAA